MPQIFPMNWIFINFLIFFTFLFLISLIYFFKLKTQIKKTKSFLNKINFLFKW
uniref:ATP synthase F0 subunit 8 n=1 Tax=Amblyomma parvitarsum TaxID=260089 RepID=UPI002E7AA7DE|nr:ATP synthase F0 subunit 8 [Amblyomma parvitarsum]WQF69033.1 ATP synthase F0 subunit 8 [Amblyomma parvitarsum]